MRADSLLLIGTENNMPLGLHAVIVHRLSGARFDDFLPFPDTGIFPSDFEIRREGPSFTVDTVAALLAEAPSAAITVIVGSDTFPEMPTWRDPARLFSLAEVAVVERPGAGPRGTFPALPPGARGVRRVSGPGLAVSATSVRERVRRGESVAYLVPETVADYIAKRRLYSDASAGTNA